VQALLTLSEGNRGVLDQIRERALPAVLEMARWKSLRYALPAYILAGRIAGIPEDQIHESWSSGDRETVIRKVAKSRAPSAQ
jgi:hypothetical protein